MVIGNPEINDEQPHYELTQENREEENNYVNTEEQQQLEEQNEEEYEGSEGNMNRSSFSKNN